MARSVFRRGADFTAAMVFEFASTNLVIELGIVMAVLLGWQFTLAEFVGGPLMIVILALLFRRFLTRRLVTEAREQADRGLLGSMEGTCGDGHVGQRAARSGSACARPRASPRSPITSSWTGRRSGRTSSAAS